MNRTGKISLFSGLACLAMLPFAALGSTSVSTTENKLNNTTLAHSSGCVKWKKVCKKVKKCADRHYDRSRNCFSCYKLRPVGHHGKQHSKHYRTCSMSTVHGLQKRGYDCHSSYKKCAKWDVKHYCKHVCAKKVRY